ncbi:signal peptidase II [Brachyspira aalborgi]|uniref:Lipoprotein signal peptidase n=1 Tax=Brachyspira aalborgi TaxID=29522 RepID=A0A5C8G0A2_9SPIR|nr:signal peptidase II [Brachyspira aalborgi]TXJ55354.1 signal peptidase II [Brachyspira aalborgi]
MKKILSKINERKIYFLISILIFIADIVSKYFIDKYLQPIYLKKIIGNFLIFAYTRNYGVAFGFLNNLPEVIKNIMPTLLKIIVSAAMILIFFIMLYINPKKQKFSMIGFAMVLGGAIGNLVDRVIRGYVTDFISMGFNETIRFPYHYNIADASITIGIVFIAIGVILFKEDFESKTKPEETIENNEENKTL